MHADKSPRQQTKPQDAPHRPPRRQTAGQSLSAGKKPKRPSVRHVAVLGYN